MVSAGLEYTRLQDISHNVYIVGYLDSATSNFEVTYLGRNMPLILFERWQRRFESTQGCDSHKGLLCP
jgi:hypothetical protein